MTSLDMLLLMRRQVTDRAAGAGAGGFGGFSGFETVPAEHTGPDPSTRRWNVS